MSNVLFVHIKRRQMFLNHQNYITHSQTTHEEFGGQ